MDEVSGRVALFGGVYNNHLALAALLDDAPSRASGIFCLGDVGAFGPHPDRSVEILRKAAVPIVQGNYDRSVGMRRGSGSCCATAPRGGRTNSCGSRCPPIRFSPDCSTTRGATSSR